MMASQEFVSIIKLVHCYIATHFQVDQRIFISKTPETDLKIAVATARSFAKEHNLFYDESVFEPVEPIITVIKHRYDWYPLELYADHADLLLKADSTNLGGRLKGTIKRARSIAESRGLDYKPNIGISLDQK